MDAALSLTYTDEQGTRRRQRFVPRSGASGWLRIEKEWNGCRWRTIGHEVVTELVAAALAVEQPICMIGDSAYDTFDWHDHLLATGVVSVAPYNARNTDDPKGIEYRVEDLIEKHSEDVQLKQSTLGETYNRRSGVERTNE